MTIKTKNYIFESDYCTSIPTPPRLYIRVQNATLVDVAAAFGNPSELTHILCDERYFDGFTRLLAISQEQDAYKIHLAKGVAAE